MAERQQNHYADIVLTCSESHHYRSEMMVEHHSLVRMLSGELKVVQAGQTYTFGVGDTLLFPRNQLATLLKYAKDGQPFRAVIMRLTTPLLRAYYTRQPQALSHPHTTGVLPVAGNPLLDSFFASLMPWFELEARLPDKLARLKLEEAIEILRSLNPHIDSVLSDFSVTGKINLAEFMERNYMFNIPLEKFSYLTGRSLTTFKRDFQQVFQLTPQRWLTRKRLELAHHYLTTENRKPIDVCYETGFENLSHFSYAFKKHFGYSPTATSRQLAR